MWKLIGPLVIPFLITAFTYYTFKIVGPFAETEKRFEEQCVARGGIVYENRGSPKICIKKDIIKIE